MTRFQPHMLFGLFALLTLLLAGAALGRIFGLSADEGVYMTGLVLAVIGWLSGRQSRRKKDAA